MWRVGFTIYKVWFWADNISSKEEAMSLAKNIAHAHSKAFVHSEEEYLTCTYEYGKYEWNDV